MKKLASVVLVGLFVVVSSIWWIETGALKKEISSRFDAEKIERKGFPFSPKIKCKNLRSKEFPLANEGWACFGTTLLGNQGWIDLSGKIIFDQKLIAAGEISIENLIFDSFEDFTLKASDLSLSLNDAPIFETDELSLDLAGGSDFAIDILGGHINTAISQLFPPNSTNMKIKGKLTSTETIFPVCFDVERYTGNDNYSSGEGRAKFTLNLNSDGYLKGDLFISSTQNCHAQLEVPDQEEVMEAFGPVLSQIPLLERICKNHWDQVPDLLPDTLGKTSAELAASIEFRHVNQILDVRKFTIDHFQIGNDRYGAELKGEISDLGNTYKLELTLKNHQAFLSEFAGYYNRWQKLLSSPDLLGPALFSVNEKMTQVATSFLESISDRHTDKEMTLSLKGSPLVVGLKTPEQMTEALQKLIADIDSELKVNPSPENMLMSPAPS